MSRTPVEMIYAIDETQWQGFQDFKEDWFIGTQGWFHPSFQFCLGPANDICNALRRPCPV